VLICDDQELMRVGLRMIVDSQPDLAVVGEAADGEAAAARALELKPDLVLMDVRMPRLDDVAATERICAALPATRVLVSTTFDLDEYAYAALRAGASGFLVKDSPAAEMLVAMRGVLRGDAMAAPSVTRRPHPRQTAHPRPGTRRGPRLRDGSGAPRRLKPRYGCNPLPQGLGTRTLARCGSSTGCSSSRTACSPPPRPPHC
jgi:DNA-binding NarL/FixJ family response regulator